MGPGSARPTATACPTHCASHRMSTCNRTGANVRPTSVHVANVHLPASQSHTSPLAIGRFLPLPLLSSSSRLACIASHCGNDPARNAMTSSVIASRPSGLVNNGLVVLVSPPIGPRDRPFWQPPDHLLQLCCTHLASHTLQNVWYRRRRM
jgi:hypothetical protein